jgi:hypothetical protein
MMAASAAALTEAAKRGKECLCLSDSRCRRLYNKDVDSMSNFRIPLADIVFLSRNDGPHIYCEDRAPETGQYTASHLELPKFIRI